jgi:hypothetical protein
MSQHQAAVSAASIKAMASELYGLTIADARAAAIAAELSKFEAGGKAAGAISIDTAPGALFRQLLLAHEPQGPRRA